MGTVLVTGLRGFIGSYCLDELIRLGHEVHGVTLQEPPETGGRVYWHQADLLEDNEVVRLVQNVRAQSLLHLAWISEHPSFWTSVMNVEWLRASLRLVKSFAEAGGQRVVVSGSCAEYEVPRAGPCLEDDTPIRPSTLYGKAKAALHMSLQGFAEQTGLSLGWARAFFVYGRGEPPTKLISTIIRDSDSGQVNVRAPQRRVDYISVKDVGRAMALLLDSKLQGAVNVGSGEATTVADIANLVFRLLGRPERAHPHRESQPQIAEEYVYADTTRLREKLSFTCSAGLQEGISEMIADRAPLL